MKSIIFMALMFAFTLSSCLDTTTNPDEENNNNNKSQYFTISGTIRNPNNHEIPDDARLVLLWISDEDETRIWGEGTINRANNTFTYSLDQDEEPFYRCFAQYNDAKVGIALICLVKADATDPVDMEKINEQIIAFVAYRSVIYRSGKDSDFEAAPWKLPWITEFEQGYTPAKPRYMDEGHDHWIPGNNDGLILEFQDDIGMVKDNMPNWS